MIRALMLATLALVQGTAQAPGVLHITVTLTDAAGARMPVPRHALLISDNPQTTSPRRVVTTIDGTAEVRLSPGSYTVESDEPVAFGGKGYQWTQDVRVTAGRDVALDLNAGNAEAAAAPIASPGQASQEYSPSLLLTQWKDSVAAVWTADSRGSGFLVDARGLVVTSQRVIGGSSAVEVQLTPSIKVAARVLAADRARDVAVLWIDPESAASVPPVPLNCADGSTPPVAKGQRLIAIGSPLRGEKEMSLGDVMRDEPRSILADFRLAGGSAGGPIFGDGGRVVGLSSSVDDDDRARSRDARVVPAGDVCAVITSAETAMRTGPRPIATRLPVEPLRPFPADALDAAARRLAANHSLYQMSSANFEIEFLTPAMVYSRQHDTQKATTSANRAPTDFGGWSDYFADAPAVLVVRVTPKLAESFWTTVARGAAYTQGVALPPIKHFKPGFSRLRAWCGDVEVRAIHPFVLSQRVSETDAIREGLYVFDPQAFGPHCTSVKLALYSEKDPEKPESRTVDPQVIQRVWEDFAAYRDASPAIG